MLTDAAVTAAATAGASGCGRASGRRQAGFADESHVEVGLRKPEVALGLDGGVDAGDLQTRVGEQLEDADQHAVVAQQVLLGDLLAQRHDLVLVVARDVVGGAPRAVSLAKLRPRMDGGLGRAVHGLHVDSFRTKHACTTPVEQRQFDADFPATLRGRLVGAVAHHAELEHVDEACRLRQSQVACRLLCRELGALNVQSLRQRDTLDVRSVDQVRRQVRKSIRQLELGLRTPQAEQPRQTLACGALRLFGAGQVQGGVGVETLLAGTPELVEVADLLHAACEFGARLGGLQHPLHVAHRFLRSQRADPGLARVRSH